MQWRRFGYSAEERSDGWFYKVYHYQPLGYKAIHLDEEEQGPFRTEQAAMANLEEWIDEQHEKGRVEEWRRLRF